MGIMKKAIVALLVIIGITGESVADDKADILAIADRLFDAVTAQDGEAWRPLLLNEGVNISIRVFADEQREQIMRMRTNAQLIEGVSPSDRTYVERWTSEPTVLIRGPIAVVWGPFDFTIDGQFSHCGVNAIDLVKTGEGWKVANLMWTHETEKCP